MKNLILDEALTKPDYYLIAKLPINVKNEIQLIPISQIIKIEADGNYCRLYISIGNSNLLNKSLLHFEQTLPKSFLRIHDKHIVNINFIEKIICNNHWIVQLQNKEKLNVSDSKKAILIARLGLKTI
jgi:two-component system LytT family response regulator